MTSTELLFAGVELMLFGMGFVFAFLILLIFSVQLMSAIVTRFAPLPQPAAGTTSTESVDADTLAAISLAIQRHRARRS
ncbi:OadG family protein [Pseudomonas oligotrophica]|uniref:OadG family protein n=1 Tax=Pseudomonas oligotrophica TaxID=2912055 RepID=UPI001F01B42F|nr:OadG family transporter subunit [Pseudomonas oligotrophica]MCF7203605.1 OadG family protein [Pseudomonas oligotrophica]